MSQFLDALIVSPIPSSARNFVVRADFRVMIGDNNTGSLWTIPAGRITDFASTPWEIWSIYPPTGLYTQAVTWHDDAYYVQDPEWPRKRCDETLKDLMGVCGCCKRDCGIFYDFVNWGGQGAWDNNARLKASGQTKMIKAVDGSIVIPRLEIDPLPPMTEQIVITCDKETWDSMMNTPFFPPLSNTID